MNPYFFDIPEPDHNKLPSVKKDLTEDTEQLIFKFLDMGFVNGDRKEPIGGQWATQTQHVADALSRRTITPMEGYDILKFVNNFKHFPQWCLIRDSKYVHLVK
jgi:hypothetical protein